MLKYTANLSEPTGMGTIINIETEQVVGNILNMTIHIDANKPHVEITCIDPENTKYIHENMSNLLVDITIPEDKISHVVAEDIMGIDLKKEIFELQKLAVYLAGKKLGPDATIHEIRDELAKVIKQVKTEIASENDMADEAV